jgi:hypothetical protein
MTPLELHCRMWRAFVTHAGACLLHKVGHTVKCWCSAAHAAAAWPTHTTRNTACNTLLWAAASLLHCLQAPVCCMHCAACVKKRVVICLVVDSSAAVQRTMGVTPHRAHPLPQGCCCWARAPCLCRCRHQTGCPCWAHGTAAVLGG